MERLTYTNAGAPMIRMTSALVVIGIVAAIGGVTASGQQDTITWIGDKKKAFDEAKKTGKPLWVLFR
jgi:hypothetical protein